LGKSRDVTYKAEGGEAAPTLDTIARAIHDFLYQPCTLPAELIIVWQILGCIEVQFSAEGNEASKRKNRSSRGGFCDDISESFRLVFFVLFQKQEMGWRVETIQ
jgi:hypothetical protein